MGQKAGVTSLAVLQVSAESHDCVPGLLSAGALDVLEAEAHSAVR